MNYLEFLYKITICRENSKFTIFPKLRFNSGKNVLKWKLSAAKYQTSDELHRPLKKVVWTLHVTMIPLWILSRWIRIRSRNSLLNPQFSTVSQNSTNLGEKVYNLAKLEVSRRYYFFTKNLISFRILSCLIHIYHKNFSTVPQNSPSLVEKVYNLAKLEGFTEVLFLHGIADIFPYFEFLNSYLKR